MNKLSTSKRAEIINMMCEGISARTISRLAKVSINTVYKLLDEAGAACAEFHNRVVRGLRSQIIQADEAWAFAYCKERNVPIAKGAPEDAGDVWTWVVLDAESRLIVSWMVGDRTAPFAKALMQDARQRISTQRVQLTTDGLRSYIDAVEDAFGADVDYAMVIKVYSIKAEKALLRHPLVKRRLYGQRIAADAGNFRRDGPDWLVRSEFGDRWYRVSFYRGVECECPDFTKGNACKHLFAVGDHDTAKHELVFRTFNALIANIYDPDRRHDPEKLFRTKILTLGSRKDGAPEPPKAWIEKRVVFGNPDLARISTSYIERHNQTMRERNRRFTRETLGFSKRVWRHRCMVALQVVYENFVSIHGSLRVSPAMAAGISDYLWSAEDIVALIDARALPLKKRGPYKPRRRKPKNSN
jgi:IS1 family transposase